MCERMEGQASLFDVDTSSGKTYQVPSVRREKTTQEKTSKLSSPKSSKSSKQTPPMFLYLKEADGLNPGVSWVTETTDASFPSHGEYTMLSFGECPNAVVESRLSQILEDSPLPKYYLSAKACQGILNRAERRGKELPELLKKALIQQSACKETESTVPIPQDVMDADGDGGGAYTLNTLDRPAVYDEDPRRMCGGGAKVH